MDGGAFLPIPAELARAPGLAVPRRRGLLFSVAVHAALLGALGWIGVRRAFPPPAQDLSPIALVMVAPPQAPAESTLSEHALTPPAESVTVSVPAPRPLPKLHLSYAPPASSMPAAPPLRRLPSSLAAANPVPTPARPMAATPALPDSAGAMAALTSAIERAVQSAALYPPMARLQHREGRAELRFSYRDGAGSAFALLRSSGSSLLDQAALAAIHAAILPPAPAPLAGKTVIVNVPVRFSLSPS